ncbi:MAG: class III extradiol ring-cleavage dioxygenase [Steroidobacteraceae bacterium]
MNTRLPTFFISHGGGPWPWIDEMRTMFAGSAGWLAHLPETLPAVPKAILSVTGHWEAPEFTVGTSTAPPMVYDYSGFPEHTYHIKYPAPGSPAIAERVRHLLSAAGIRCDTDATRGFDHGTFVPLYVMYPEATIPVVQLSIKHSMDPREHLHAGTALQPLRDEGVLVVGSGLSYHNMRGFRGGGGPASVAFEHWLTSAVSEPNVATRTSRLLSWEQAPAARLSHPREDHLIPLMVVAGAAGEDQGRRDFLDNAMGVVMASYRFGA